jgi:uncharacterized protein
MISEEKIQEAKRRLIEAYNPIAIYLFGSYAWGEPTEDSDIDLYILFKKSTDINFDLKKRGNRQLAGIGFAVDFLLNYQVDFNKRAKHPSTLERKIKTEGKLIYKNATTRSKAVSV